MSDFLILPNQLFEKKYLDKKYNYLIYEHPDFFTKYNFNKKKLILHRASMKYYFDYLKKKKFKVQYLEFNEKLPKKDFVYFDPINKMKIKGEMLETPNFILTKKLYEKYREKTDKFMFTNFYMWSKKQLNLYPDLKSKDKMNRERFKDGIKIPKVPSNKKDKEYIDEAIEYVNKHFSKNYGNTDNFIFPVRHKTAKKWVKDFFKKRINNFGPYQDFVKQGEYYMYHSLLSTSINIGLLNPNEIIDDLKKIKDKVPINSFEGFLRQLFWREYQRYTYIYVDWNVNYIGNKKSFMKFYTYIGALSCVGLYWFNLDNIYFGLLCYFLASVGAWLSWVFYNSYLPEIAQALKIKYPVLYQCYSFSSYLKLIKYKLQKILNYCAQNYFLLN